MKVAYADPPYPGQAARHYGDHPDYAGEVNHAELLERLDHDYDGWLLHTSVPALAELLPLAPSARVCAWVKPFASFKGRGAAGDAIAYAWEPILVVSARPPRKEAGMTLRDYIMAPITMRKGLAGAKPPAVIRYGFMLLGLEETDELDDLYPGTGAVADEWARYRRAPMLPFT